jgi:hypothetical protein
VRRNLNIRRRSDNNHRIGCGKDPGLLDLHPTNNKKHRGEKCIPSIGSRHRGSKIIGSRGRWMSLNAHIHRIENLSRLET